MNIEELTKTINYLLDNNLKLIEKGHNKISVCIEGNAGIGKTSVVQQIAEERNAKYVKLCLAELEEIGDLCGIPIKEYQMFTPDKSDEVTVAEKMIPQYVSMGYSLCPDCPPKMSYAVPSWVPEDEDKEIILCLDDFTRASSLFMQAIMSLVQFGEYVSWKLPKKAHLILTSNPEGAEYSISTSLDSAQASRMLKFNVDFDVKPYAKWMDRMEMPGVMINFALMTPEIFERSHVINARSYTMFANAISGISNYSDPKSLALISTIAKGCFGNDDVVSGLFVQFVHNKLDRLITPEDILKGEWEKVKDNLKECIQKDGGYRADIASTLTIRFINYLEIYFNKDEDVKKSEKAIDRIVELVTCQEKLLSEDLIFKLIKTLVAKHPNRFKKLVANPQIRLKIIS